MKQPAQTRTIKTGALYRSFELDRAGVDEGARTVPVIFSSETPVQRWFGEEILDHDKKSVDLSFLNSGRAPVLKDHDRREQVGVIESAEISADRKGRAVMRFGESQAAADEFKDILAEIRVNVSVGYMIKKMVLEEEDADKGDTFRVTEWRPLEVSMVSVPADEQAHVGRGAGEHDEFETIIIDRRKHPATEDRPMTPEEKAALEAQIRADERAKVIAEVDVDQVRAGANKDAATIMEMGERHDMGKEAREAITAGKSPDQFGRQVADILAARNQKIVDTTNGGELGLTEKERKQYSVVRLLNHLTNPADPVAREAAGFELECNQAFAKLRNKEPQGAWIPPDPFKGQRDLSVGTDTAGGYLKATEQGGLIELLRNKLVLQSMGARVLGDLVGDMAFPRQAGGATAYWVAEAVASTESQQTLGQILMQPKAVSGFTEYGRKLMKQASIDVEMFVRDDLMNVLALGLDAAGLHGAVNGPTGIAATTGVGSVAGGANGASPTYSNMLELEEDVAVANADQGSLGYVSNPKVRRVLKGTFTNPTYGDKGVWDKNEVNGYKALASNQVSSTLTKGTASGICSAIFFGDWSQVIIGLWSGIDVLVNPYALDTAGGVRITAFQDADVAVRQPGAFSVMLDALTP